MQAKVLRAFTAASVVAGAMIAPTVAAEVSGAGATFPYPIYAKWAEAYKAETGIGVNYESIGSGDGIRRIQRREVIFGATDMPLSVKDLDAAGLVQFPTVIGGIVSLLLSAVRR